MHYRRAATRYVKFAANFLIMGSARLNAARLIAQCVSTVDLD
jgi:hypothetical protein